MHIKATIVAYAFSVQYFENATIVTYAGLRVNVQQNIRGPSTVPRGTPEISSGLLLM